MLAGFISNSISSLVLTLLYSAYSGRQVRTAMYLELKSAFGAQLNNAQPSAHMFEDQIEAAIIY